MTTAGRSVPTTQDDPPDPREPVRLLLRQLHSSPSGLSGREAGRRLTVYGPNALVRRGGRRWPRELARQFTHPLALLLGVVFKGQIQSRIEAMVTVAW
ncbi:cation-transporting P-type ATPase [Kitasatospora sp. NPDC059646]|uniref:cation-transporting P-type ATPase n=1 Tax=Kitasatospora sp. NPDC059646 TaxID=3346893 RepID=UPI0036794EFC